MNISRDLRVTYFRFFRLIYQPWLIRCENIKTYSETQDVFEKYFSFSLFKDYAYIPLHVGKMFPGVLSRGLHETEDIFESGYYFAFHPDVYVIFGQPSLNLTHFSNFTVLRDDLINT